MADTFKKEANIQVEAIKKDVQDGKISSAKDKIKDLKEWFFTTKHDEITPHAKLRNTLWLISILVYLVIHIWAGCRINMVGTDLEISKLKKAGKVKTIIKDIVIPISSLIFTNIAYIKALKKVDNYTSAEIDSTIEYCTKKKEEMKKVLDKMDKDDPNYNATNSALRSYNVTLEWAKQYKID